ncbi:MAG: universal stress protein [Gemmatimonadales bacterium]
MKILIAYDGSSHADGAVSDLALAGMPASGEARVLTVADVLLPPPLVGRLVEGEPEPASLERGPAQAVSALRSAWDTARKGAARARTVLPGWTVTAVAGAGEPAWGVIEESDTWQPDLVVVGSQGRGAIERFLLGSVSHKVLTEGRCSVRIARPRDGAAGGLPRFLVGVDGSTGSTHVLARVAARRWPSGSEALLLCAVDTRLALAPRHAFDDEIARGREAVERAAAELRSASPGLTVTTRVREGEPKPVLLDEAKGWRANTIFVGARGLGATERVLLGSVSTAVAMRASCSVEVIYGPDAGVRP